MTDFSDQFHLDTCAGRHCNALLARSAMKRLVGRRGWFCPRCQILYGGTTQERLDLRDGR